MAEEIVREKLKKYREILEMGINPFKETRFERTHTASDIKREFSWVSPDRHSDSQVRVAGRIRGKRVHGGSAFMDLEDATGRVQLYFARDKLGEESYSFARKYVDIGDILGAWGRVFRTRRGELTVEVLGYKLLAKSIRPLPSEWHGLKEVEARYRQRYLDLIMNPEIKRRFQLRAKIIAEIRRFLDSRGFLEVETPMMSYVATGALARPFKTWHNELGVELYLRIAPELYLKRLIVGGYEKVYEIGKVFRNESIDRMHNPDFTMLELYQAYSDYNDIMKLTEELIATVAERALGTTRIAYQGREIDLTPPFKRVKFYDAIEEHTGVDFRGLNREETLEKALELGVQTERTYTKGHILDKILEHSVVPKLVQPTFILDYPVEISPLAKASSEPGLVERFELFIAGMEVANAFSELNDPFDQRRRFMEQLELRKMGDEEAHEMDEDYITALEYGMPPTGGLGIGVDRLVMILTDAPSIREVILFPVLRPEKK